MSVILALGTMVLTAFIFILTQYSKSKSRSNKEYARLKKILHSEINRLK